MVEPTSNPEILDEIMQYEKYPFEETGLLYISHQVSESFKEICNSLELEQEAIEKIDNEEGDESHKIFCALVDWGERHEKRTWGDLAHQFCNHEELQQIIRTYLTNYQPHEGGAELYPFSCSFEETGKGVTEPSVEAYPRSPHSNRPHLLVRDNLEKLQMDFNNLLAKANKNLASQPSIIDDLRVRLAALCVDVKSNIRFFDEMMCKLFTNMKVPEIIMLLTKHRVWDPINYRILKKLLDLCVPFQIEIHDDIERHACKVEVFQRTTLLRDYMAIVGSNILSSPHGCTTITVKFERKYKEYTMAKFAHDQSFLAGQFLLEEFIFRFKEAHSGCVSITWFIPKSSLPLLSPHIINEKRKELREKEVIEIMVDNKFIYRIPNLVINSPPLHMDSKSETVDYRAMYDESIKNPTEFWSRQAKKILKWVKIFDEVDGCRLEEGVISWFTGGQLNVSYNCLDRHAVKNGERTALIWEKNRTKEQINGIHECISYRKLLEMTCQIANVLRTNCGIKKGDRIVIYMPTCPLAVAAMLACARIGAVHCVLYSVLGVRDIMKRIKSSEAKVVVTAQKAFVGDKCLHLRSNIDESLKLLEKTNANLVNHVLVWKMNDCDIGDTKIVRDTDLETAMKAAPTYCEPVAMESEDPLFIMYTSGTTDEPTGILHTQAGYLLCAAMTHKYVFDYKIGEVFACVSDLGWVAAHTFVVYGPLCNGGTTVLFQGTATYPDSGRYWEMVERLKVNHFYTSPAAIKKLMKDNLNCANGYNVSSLKTIALGGEPISTATWMWYYTAVGKRNCLLIDTYGQTELGGFALSPWPGSKLKPGVCAKPFFGVEPIILNEKGEILQESGVQGLLCFRHPIPAMGREIIGGSFKNKYFSSFPGKYFTGDWAYRDMDGDYQILGRKDDIVRIKGVWIQIPEIESSIVGKSNNIENASYIGLSSEPSATTDACVVVEVRKSVSESQQKSKKFYRDILESVKSSIINIAGEHALPRFVLVVKESVYTWSNKMCRSIYRDMAEGFFKPLLKHVDPSENIVLLDYTTSPLPPVANKWEHLQ